MKQLPQQPAIAPTATTSLPGQQVVTFNNINSSGGGGGVGGGSQFVTTQLNQTNQQSFQFIQNGQNIIAVPQQFSLQQQQLNQQQQTSAGQLVISPAKVESGKAGGINSMKSVKSSNKRKTKPKVITNTPTPTISAETHLLNPVKSISNLQLPLQQSFTKSFAPPVEQPPVLTRQEHLQIPPKLAPDRKILKMTGKD